MMNFVLLSPQTGDGFNPILLGAVAVVCLCAIIFLVFSGKRKK